MEVTYRVYILQNTVGRFYTGLSEDVAHRLAQHNAGAFKWTKKFRPWKLVRTSETLNLSNDRKLENWLKRQKGGDGFFDHTGLMRPVSGS